MRRCSVTLETDLPFQCVKVKVVGETREDFLLSLHFHWLPDTT